jgi:hypothetical protein
MISTKVFLAGLLACSVVTDACSQTEVLEPLTAAGIFVGSTPGDSLIKSLLAIHPETKVDFIRWDLALNHNENRSNVFVLNVTFGEAQPNTPGFKEGGKKLSFEGMYTVSRPSNRNVNGEIWRLKSEKLPSTISLVKVNDNLFHLLTPQGHLMVGNDGWSYTLNRNEPLTNISGLLPSLTASTALLNDTARQVIFTGRTPCSEFSKQYNFQVGNDCNKLKWKLVLQRDPTTSLPTTYTLYWTLHRSGVVEGKWRIIKGSDTNPDVIIYQLDPDKPGDSISFLAGDKNVIYFLDKKNQLFTGNKDFSYTLNKRKR